MNFRDWRRALVLSGVALCLVGASVVIYRFGVRERVEPPRAPVRLAVSGRSQTVPVTADALPMELRRKPVAVVPAASWQSKLSEEQRALCFEMLQDESVDVVLIRVLSRESYGTLSGEKYHAFRVRVIDGSEKLGLQRDSTVDASIRISDAGRDLAIDEVCFAFLANGDPVAKAIGMPPRIRKLKFACPALSESVAISTAAKARASPSPAAPRRPGMMRLLETFRRAANESGKKPGK